MYANFRYTLNALCPTEFHMTQGFPKEFAHDEEKATTANVDMSTIDLKAQDLYDKEKVDLETIVIDDVFKLLQPAAFGLFDPKKLESEEQNPFLQFLLSVMWNPLSWVMEAAALVAMALSNGGGRAPDWQDFVGIVLLLFINYASGFYGERGAAGNTVKSLMDSLAPKAKVKRAGHWSEIESADLVLGVVQDRRHRPRSLEAIKFCIDQAPSLSRRARSLGSVLLVRLRPRGSTCKQGEAEGVAHLHRCQQDDDTTGHLRKILAQIGSFCLILVLYAGSGYSYRRGLDNIPVLLIGGIPIAMPSVLSANLAVGAQQLAKHKAITGTLTTNKLTIDQETILTFSPPLRSRIASNVASQNDSVRMSRSSVLGLVGGALLGVPPKRSARPATPCISSSRPNPRAATPPTASILRPWFRVTLEVLIVCHAVEAHSPAHVSTPLNVYAPQNSSPHIRPEHHARTSLSPKVRPSTLAAPRHSQSRTLHTPHSTCSRTQVPRASSPHTPPPCALPSAPSPRYGADLSAPPLLASRTLHAAHREPPAHPPCCVRVRLTQESASERGEEWECVQHPKSLSARRLHQLRCADLVVSAVRNASSAPRGSAHCVISSRLRSRRAGERAGPAPPCPPLVPADVVDSERCTAPYEAGERSSSASV
ncbi:hypothetical protein C8R43DRAFT_1172823 [Mycena crocata]|nr:hypothetical protein C8R43DRAFT_1174977 [Mycena crocata]KAJ7106455.1 hypothetical protein C8R43DRAFT_1164396 [Mycena crocata]KAJ7162524.1 hypothetical protein C8R43DRAFT_1172823 [Mycena crocata]